MKSYFLLKICKAIIGSLLAVLSLNASAKISCVADAIQYAPRLVEYHFGALNGFEVEIDESRAKTLRPIRNEANPAPKLTVVEVWATIYKANYRTRFFFHMMGTTCILVGQEVIEVDGF